jgi:hypothetical protein
MRGWLDDVVGAVGTGTDIGGIVEDVGTTLATLGGETELLLTVSGSPVSIVPVATWLSPPAKLAPPVVIDPTGAASLREIMPVAAPANRKTGIVIARYDAPVIAVRSVSFERDTPVSVNFMAYDRMMQRLQDDPSRYLTRQIATPAGLVQAICYDSTAYDQIGRALVVAHVPRPPSVLATTGERAVVDISNVDFAFFDDRPVQIQTGEILIDPDAGGVPSAPPSAPVEDKPSMLLPLLAAGAAAFFLLG